jgi:hypothetical protein
LGLRHPIRPTIPTPRAQPSLPVSACAHPVPLPGGSRRSGRIFFSPFLVTERRLRKSLAQSGSISSPCVARLFHCSWATRFPNGSARASLPESPACSVAAVTFNPAHGGTTPWNRPRAPTNRITTASCVLVVPSSVALVYKSQPPPTVVSSWPRRSRENQEERESACADACM